MMGGGATSCVVECRPWCWCDIFLASTCGNVRNVRFCDAEWLIVNSTVSGD